MMKYFHFVLSFVVEIKGFRIQFLVSAKGVIDYSTRLINSCEKFGVVCKFHKVHRMVCMYAYE